MPNVPMPTIVRRQKIKLYDKNHKLVASCLVDAPHWVIGYKGKFYLWRPNFMYYVETIITNLDAVNQDEQVLINVMRSHTRI